MKSEKRRIIDCEVRINEMMIYIRSLHVAYREFIFLISFRTKYKKEKPEIIN